MQSHSLAATEDGSTPLSGGRVLLGLMMRTDVKWQR
jgi:hypothetical protein